MFKKKRRRFHRELICPFALEECVGRLQRFRYETEQTSFLLDLQLTPMKEGGYRFLITSTKPDHLFIQYPSKVILNGRLEPLSENATRITISRIERLGVHLPESLHRILVPALVLIFISWIIILDLAFTNDKLLSMVIFTLPFILIAGYAWFKGTAHLNELYHLLFEEELVCRWDV